MHTALSDSMSEMFLNNFLSKKSIKLVCKHSHKKMMASLLLQKRGYLQLGVIFQGFWTRKLPLNNPVQLCLFFSFPPPHHSHTFDFHFKCRVIYPYDWKCSMPFWKWVHCPAQIRLQMRDLSLWNRSLTNSAVSPRHSGRGVCLDGSLWDQPF